MSNNNALVAHNNSYTATPGHRTVTKSIIVHMTTHGIGVTIRTEMVLDARDNETMTMRINSQAVSSHEMIARDQPLLPDLKQTSKPGEDFDHFLEFAEAQMYRHAKRTRKLLGKHVAKQIDDVVYAASHVGSMTEKMLSGWARRTTDDFIARRFLRLCAGGTYSNSRRAVISSLRDRAYLGGSPDFRLKTLTGNMQYV